MVFKASAEEAEDLQQSELVVLSAIYADQLQHIESAAASGPWKKLPGLATKSSHPEFRLHLPCLQPLELQPFVSVDLRIKLPRLYPFVVPQWSLEKCVGLTETHKRALSEQLTELCKTAAEQGVVVVYDMAVVAQEYITDNHDPAADAACEAAARAQSGQMAASIHEEFLRTQAQAAQLRNEQMTADMQLKAEQQRREKETELAKVAQEQQKREERLKKLRLREQRAQRGMAARARLRPSEDVLAAVKRVMNVAVFTTPITLRPVSAADYKGSAASRRDTSSVLTGDELHFESVVLAPSSIAVPLGVLYYATPLSMSAEQDDSDGYGSAMNGFNSDFDDDDDDDDLLSDYEGINGGITSSSLRATRSATRSASLTAPCLPRDLMLHEITISNSHYSPGKPGYDQLTGVLSLLERLRTMPRHRRIAHVEAVELTRPNSRGVRKLYVLLSGMSGRSLGQLLNVSGPLGKVRSRDYMRQIVSALDHLAAYGVNSGGGLSHGELHSGCVLIPDSSFTAPVDAIYGSRDVLDASGYDRSSPLGPIVFGAGYIRALQLLHSETPLLSERDERRARRLSRTADAPINQVTAEISPATAVLLVEDTATSGRARDMWATGILFLEMLLGPEVLARFASVAAVMRSDEYSELPSIFKEAVRRMLNSAPAARPTPRQVLSFPAFSTQPSHPLLLSHASASNVSASTTTHDSPADYAFNVGVDRAVPLSPARERVGAGGRQRGDYFGPTQQQARRAPSKPARSQSDTSGYRGSSSEAASPQPPSIPAMNNDGSSSSLIAGLSQTHSRYATDFEEIQFLGRGGFGEVVKARNKLDSRVYAIKRIRLDSQPEEERHKIYREVNTLSRLHHEFVVRYYTTWVEDSVMYEDAGDTDEDETDATETDTATATATVTAQYASIEYSPEDYDDDGEIGSMHGPRPLPRYLTASVSTYADGTDDTADDTGAGDDSDGEDDFSDQAQQMNALLRGYSRQNRLAGRPNSDFKHGSTNGNGRKNKDKSRDSRDALSGGGGVSQPGIQFGSIGGDLSTLRRSQKASGGVSSVLNSAGATGDKAKTRGWSIFDTASVLAGITSDDEDEEDDTDGEEDYTDEDYSSRIYFDRPGNNMLQRSPPVLPEMGAQRVPSIDASDELCFFGQSVNTTRSSSPALSTEVTPVKQQQQQQQQIPLRQSTPAKTTMSRSRSRQRHRNVQILYIQMEYCENKSLQNLIDGRLDERTSWRLLRQIVEGLSYIHMQGMIHRDLKPSNLFIDADQNIKIGDFGLATNATTSIAVATAALPELNTNSYTMARDRHSRNNNNNNTVGTIDDSMTGDVGTSFYVAPEVSSRRTNTSGVGVNNNNNNNNSNSTMRYSQKVDMYSLGVIFFEMCYPFRTRMERYKTLTGLCRKQPPEFPLDFEYGKSSNQHRIIEILLSHNPRERMSSAELAKSPLLPPRAGDTRVMEYINSLSGNDAPHMESLMSALFKRIPDKYKDISYDSASSTSGAAGSGGSGGVGGSSSGGNNSVSDNGLIQVYYPPVRERMTEIFRQHAAVEAYTPLLMPRQSITQDEIRPMLLFDQHGNILQLPTDLTAPYARYIARNDMLEIKRYVFDKVYSSSTAVEPPRETLQASIDFVNDSSLHNIVASEVLFMVEEVAREFPPANVASALSMPSMSLSTAAVKSAGEHHDHPLVFVLNHSILLDVIIAHCRVPENAVTILLVEMGRFMPGGLQGAVTEREKLLRKALRTSTALSRVLPRECIDSLLKFVFVDTIRACQKRINDLVTDPQLRERAKAAFRELSVVERTMTAMGVTSRRLCLPLMSLKHPYYQNSYFFVAWPSIGRDRGPLAYGGRYDALVERFRPPRLDVTAGQRDIAAFGAVFSMYDLVKQAAEVRYPLRWIQRTSIDGGSIAAASLISNSTVSSVGIISGSSALSSTMAIVGGSVGGGSGGGGSGGGTVVNLADQLPLMQRSGSASDVILSSGVINSIPSVLGGGSNILDEIIPSNHADDSTFDLWSAGRCEIVVASTKPGMLIQRLLLVRELWRHGLPADFVYGDDEHTMMDAAELIDVCRKQAISWIVTIKSTGAAAGSGVGPSVAQTSSQSPAMSASSAAAESLKRMTVSVQHSLRKTVKEMSVAQLMWYLSEELRLQADYVAYGHANISGRLTGPSSRVTGLSSGSGAGGSSSSGAGAGIDSGDVSIQSVPRLDQVVLGRRDQFSTLQRLGTGVFAHPPSERGSSDYHYHPSSSSMSSMSSGMDDGSHFSHSESLDYTVDVIIPQNTKSRSYNTPQRLQTIARNAKRRIDPFTLSLRPPTASHPHPPYVVAVEMSAANLKRVAEMEIWKDDGGSKIFDSFGRKEIGGAVNDIKNKVLAIKKTGVRAMWLYSMPDDRAVFMPLES
ncbi:hypothetical protein GQ42DRAFT_162500 [Ramicandelaber brevisporus]|nr:hypothetical protein GQ42DRAFT_162500 [Ramicandelaber brevisporus]